MQSCRRLSSSSPQPWPVLSSQPHGCRDKHRVSRTRVAIPSLRRGWKGGSLRRGHQRTEAGLRGACSRGARAAEKAPQPGRGRASCLSVRVSTPASLRGRLWASPWEPPPRARRETQLSRQPGWTTTLWADVLAPGAPPPSTARVTGGNPTAGRARPVTPARPRHTATPAGLPAHSSSWQPDSRLLALLCPAPPRCLQPCLSGWTSSASCCSAPTGSSACPPSGQGSTSSHARPGLTGVPPPPLQVGGAAPE